MMSHCWVRVGMPVDGPARCTFMITAGTSAKYDRPMNSVIREMPGPEVAVKTRAPFHDAPITMALDARSSSPRTMADFFFPGFGSCRRLFPWLGKKAASDDDRGVGDQREPRAAP